VQAVEGAEQARGEERVDPLVPQQGEGEQGGEVERRREPAGVPAAELAPSEAAQEEHGEREGDRVRDLLYPARRRAEETHGECDQPDHERRLVEVELPIEPGREPVAGAQHLVRHRGVADVAVVGRLDGDAHGERCERE
jgi:hypothetical protein